MTPSGSSSRVEGMTLTPSFLARSGQATASKTKSLKRFSSSCRTSFFPKMPISALTLVSSRVEVNPIRIGFSFFAPASLISSSSAEVKSGLISSPS